MFPDRQWPQFKKILLAKETDLRCNWESTDGVVEGSIEVYPEGVDSAVPGLQQHVWIKAHHLNSVNSSVKRDYT